MHPSDAEQLKYKEKTKNLMFGDALLSIRYGKITIYLEEELNLLPKTDAVRVMNLHRAKGLEAPVVFLAHPAKQVNYPPDI